jgi:predicted Rossmann-fold nucleotide-binding protein/SAM-dependent methyltransferase
VPAVVKLPKKPLGLKEKKKDESRVIQNITFFGDSAIPEGDEIYKSVWDAAKLLAENTYTIVDGGGPGIMKAATDGAESVDGNTIAVYWEPKLASVFEGKNLVNETDESQTESNYLMRTLGLIEKGDVFVVCKGGTGTVSEFGLVWCLAKLYYGCHKPVILYGDFWDGLIEAFQKAMYIDEVELEVLDNAKNPKELLDLIKSYEIKFAHCKNKKYDGDEKAFVMGGRAQITIDEYNRVASAYKSEQVGKLLAQEQLDDFVDLVHPPARVLDIGCGPGQDLRYLSQKYAMTGVELAKRFVEIARLENPNANIIYGDIAKVDIGKNTYKGIWARDSIHHLPEEKLDDVFKKLADALVEDGILYVIVREGQGEIVETEKKNYTKIERFYHLFTPEELISRAKKAGLTLEKIDHTKRSHKWLIGVFRK